MKKLMIATTMCFGFFTGNMHAQSTSPREDLYVGFKAGLNHSNVWDEQGQDFTADGKTGFAGGIVLSVPIAKFIGIQPELLYSQKGFQGSGIFLGQTYTFSRTTSYIDVPIHFQLKPVEAVSFVIGPQYSFLLSKKDVFNFGGNSLVDEEEFENNNIRKNIFGVSLGVDVHISRLMLSGRACWDLQNNNGDGTSNNPRYKNQWIQFTVGYRL